MQGVVRNDTRFVAVGEAAVWSDTGTRSRRNPGRSPKSPFYIANCRDRVAAQVQAAENEGF